MTLAEAELMELAEGQIVYARPRRAKVFEPNGDTQDRGAGGGLSGVRSARAAGTRSGPCDSRLAILRTGSGSWPAARSASVTDSRTSRMLARSAIHTSWRGFASPWKVSSSGGSPRTLTSGPSTSRMISARVISSGGRASQ